MPSQLSQTRLAHVTRDRGKNGLYMWPTGASPLTILSDVYTSSSCVSDA